MKCRRRVLALCLLSALPAAALAALSAGDVMHQLSAVLPIDIMHSGYWPWWLGGLALGLVTVTFALVMRMPLGASSSWDRVANWTVDRELQAEEDAFAGAEARQQRLAMAQATIAQFGDELTGEMRAEILREAEQAGDGVQARTPVSAHVVFLLTTLLGAMLAAFTEGKFAIRWDLGEEFVSIFGRGPWVSVLLVFGGFLIGFGTRMSGGCTSGHGLSGCSRFQGASLAGTAAFFGAAVMASLVVDWWAGRWW
ncbi:MAG: YeeE/YedE family protein [Gammaproteobacteria bacterium]|nr:YeeE/YedE family protein [Gammaproteobacteria bacterium]